MHDTNHIPPERMTPEQRRNDVAVLLARGLIRLRDAAAERSAGHAAESEFELGFSGDQRLHRYPVNNENTEAP